MNTKATSLFLCALLASSFAHDWHNAKLNFEQYGRLSSQVLKSVQEPPTSYARLLAEDPVYYCSNSNGTVIGFTNSGQNKALVIDWSAKLALIVDGLTGAAVVVDMEANVAKYILVGVWISLTTSFDQFISVVDCKVLYDTAIISVDITSPTLIVQTLVSDVISSLDAAIGLALQADNTFGLGIAIELSLDISTNLVDNLNASLVDITSTTLVECAGGISTLQAIIQTFVYLQDRLDIDAVVEATVSFSLSTILAFKSGLAAFVYVWKGLADSLDLAAVISEDLLTDEQALLEVCIGLGGRLSTGVTGVFKVILYILQMIDGSIDLDVLLTEIVAVSTSVNASIDINTSLTELSDCLVDQSTTYNTSSSLSVPTDFVADLLNSTFVRSEVDISSIVATLCGGVTTTVMDQIVKTCSFLNFSNVSVELLFTTLLRVHIAFLETVVGRGLLGFIVPDVLSGFDTAVKCLSILVETTLEDVMNILSEQGVVAALLSVSVTEKVYTSCKTSITTYASVDLDVCVNATSAASENVKIQSMIQTADKLC